MVQELLPALRARFGAETKLGVLTSSPVEGLDEHEILCEAPEPALGDSVAGAQQWKPVLQEVWKTLESDPPDLFVAVSHHGFNMVLAAELKALEGTPTRTVMVAPPEIWAWDVRTWLRALGPFLRWAAPSPRSVPWVLQAMLNRGRSTLEYFDAVACLLESNLKAYRRQAQRYRSDALVVKVGHAFARYAEPAIQERIRDEAQEMRARLAPAADDLLIGLFPGSRQAEVDCLLPIMLNGTDQLRDRFGDRLKLVATASDERREAQIRRMLDDHSRQNSAPPISLVTGQAEAVMTAADFGLMCSGTVTLLAASLGLPSVVVYDRGWSLQRRILAHLLLRRGRVSSERGAEVHAFSLPSAVLGERVFPELSMRQCTAEGVATSLDELIDDDGARTQMRKHQERLLDLLRPSPPEEGCGEITDTPMQRVAEVCFQLVHGKPDRPEPRQA
jgi:lipid A disaccharide synthetase